MTNAAERRQSFARSAVFFILSAVFSRISANNADDYIVYHNYFVYLPLEISKLKNMTKSLLTLALASLATTTAMALPNPALYPMSSNNGMFEAVKVTKSPQTFSATRAEGNTKSFDFTLAYDPQEALRLAKDNDNRDLPKRP